jgi:hypothetical protein
MLRNGLALHLHGKSGNTQVFELSRLLDLDWKIAKLNRNTSHYAQEQELLLSVGPTLGMIFGAHRKYSGIRFAGGVSINDN